MMRKWAAIAAVLATVAASPTPTPKATPTPAPYKLCVCGPNSHLLNCMPFPPGLVPVPAPTASAK